ncbi:hypothetical protein O0I10_006316 [Lichtheimia ornata]|uniref:Uncharacterized protein n=1 Tax=Lichtheimia ornata TaxID=688661 RepID=A0AAD7V399_9FUNG|nr:uncharacterized protein O0I10_006316 [Lichtheimia ornata]KAJ8658045.1 hypothetical protein O0I10_006316 [Lichtheimia ornata]
MDIWVSLHVGYSTNYFSSGAWILQGRTYHCTPCHDQATTSTAFLSTGTPYYVITFEHHLHGRLQHQTTAFIPFGEPKRYLASIFLLTHILTRLHATHQSYQHQPQGIWEVEQATCEVEQATCEVEQATCEVEQATCEVEHAISEVNQATARSGTTYLRSGTVDSETS